MKNLLSVAALAVVLTSFGVFAADAVKAAPAQKAVRVAADTAPAKKAEKKKHLKKSTEPKTEDKHG